jgi:hypothetical protein
MNEEQYKAIEKLREIASECNRIRHPFQNINPMWKGTPLDEVLRAIIKEFDFPKPLRAWRPFCYDCYDDEGEQHEGCVEADRKTLEEQAGPCQFCTYRFVKEDKL